MKNVLRLASLAALVLGTATFSSGCIVSECEDEDGATIDNCVQGETPTIYKGTERTESVAYTAGGNVQVDGFNGRILVTGGAAADTVEVVFMPETGRRADQREEADLEMANDLVTTATASGSDVLIDASRANGNSNTYLGAEIEVRLPASFTGQLTILQGNGEVAVDLGGMDESRVQIDNDGAGDVLIQGLNAAQFDIEGDFDIEVDVDAFPTEDSSIGAVGNLGDVTLQVPAASVGSIQATSSDSNPVSGPNPLPAGWTEDVAAENSKTYSFGETEGANLRVFTDSTGLGEVIIVTK